MCQGRTDSHHIIRFCQLVGNQMAFRDMFESQLESELLCQTDRSQNVIRLMGMDLHRDFTLEDRDHGFTFVVECGHLGNVITGSFLLCQIFPGFEHHVADDCSRGHTGAVALVSVASLRILAESTLHGNRILDDGIIDTAACRLDSDPGAADGIGAALTCRNRRYTAQSRMLNAWIKRIIAVDRSQLRRADIVHFIVVSAFETDTVAVQSEMGMCINETRIDIKSGCIENFPFFRKTGADGLDLSVFDQKICFVGFSLNHVVDHTVFN